ncbi:MAG: inositol monophosphatase family protein [Candidatus Paceibacterota bacterium]
MKDIEKYSELAIKAANLASAHLLSATSQAPLNYKEDHHGALDYATETDIRCEEMIRDILGFSDIPVYGEELAGPDPTKGLCWVVDPLDGTLNWANNIPIYAVSIALAIDGEPILGVISLPSLNRLYHGSIASKATVNNKPIKVSTQPLTQSILACDLHLSSSEPLINKIKAQSARVRLLGSSAYELALVAEGSFAAIISPYSKFHDVAAGVAIISAAEGVTLSLDGSHYKKASGSIVSGSLENVNKLIKAINS